MPSTPSSRAISRRGRRTPLYCIVDVLEVTCSDGLLANAVINSSVIPSAKYSWEESPERFSRGRTAIDRILAAEVDACLPRLRFISSSTASTASADATRMNRHRGRTDVGDRGATGGGAGAIAAAQPGSGIAGG